ncbi:Retrovirus-related Pol polyprotein from transposon opus [Dictyocoela muelleri]|nr:Retrovirus-related Pol polyprotein from transposon opus [Dictyocoela muelleri]
MIKDIDNCFSYIDDIVIFSKNIKSHNEDLIRILTILKEKHVKINFDKSSLFKKSIRILGLIVSEGGISADTRGLENEIFTQELKSKNQIQQVIGICNWYRNFVSDITNILEPITKLKKNKNKKI